jgi:hypothetical protein
MYVAVALVEGHQQRIENGKLVTLNIVCREMLQSFKYTNNFLLNIFFLTENCGHVYNWYTLISQIESTKI